MRGASSAPPSTPPSAAPPVAPIDRDSRGETHGNDEPTWRLHMNYSPSILCETKVINTGQLMRGQLPGTVTADRLCWFPVMEVGSLALFFRSGHERGAAQGGAAAGPRDVAAARGTAGQKGRRPPKTHRGARVLPLVPVPVRSTSAWRAAASPGGSPHAMGPPAPRSRAAKRPAARNPQRDSSPDAAAPPPPPQSPPRGPRMPDNPVWVRSASPGGTLAPPRPVVAGHVVPPPAHEHAARVVWYRLRGSAPAWHDTMPRLMPEEAVAARVLSTWPQPPP